MEKKSYLKHILSHFSYRFLFSIENRQEQKEKQKTKPKKQYQKKTIRKNRSQFNKNWMRCSRIDVCVSIRALNTLCNVGKVLSRSTFAQYLQ